MACLDEASAPASWAIWADAGGGAAEAGVWPELELSLPSGFPEASEQAELEQSKKNPKRIQA